MIYAPPTAPKRRNIWRALFRVDGVANDVVKLVCPARSDNAELYVSLGWFPADVRKRFAKATSFPLRFFAKCTYDATGEEDLYLQDYEFPD